MEITKEEEEIVIKKEYEGNTKIIRLPSVKIPSRRNLITQEKHDYKNRSIDSLSIGRALKAMETDLG